MVLAVGHRQQDGCILELQRPCPIRGVEVWEPLLFNLLPTCHKTLLLRQDTATRRYPHEDIHTKTFTWRHANMTCRILDGRLRGAAVLLSTRYDACTSSAEWHREVYIRTRSKFPMKASHLLDKAQRSQIVSQISLNSLAVVSQILFCHHGHRRPSTLQPSGHPLALGRPFTRLT